MMIKIVIVWLWSDGDDDYNESNDNSIITLNVIILIRIRIRTDFIAIRTQGFYVAHKRLYNTQWYNLVTKAMYEINRKTKTTRIYKSK